MPPDAPPTSDRRTLTSGGALRDGLYIGALAALVVVAFFDVMGAGRGLFFRDHQGVYRSRWRYVAESLRGLRLADFDPFDPAGVPLEQKLNGTYLPTSLLFLLKDFDVAYDLHIAALAFVFGVGVYGFARHLGARRVEALLASAVAMLSGPVLSLENLTVMLQGLAYAPWLYWALAATLRGVTLARTAALALAIGCHLQGIMPEVLLLDVISGAALLAHLRPRVTGTLAGTLALAAALGGALAAVSLGPVLEVLPYTRRGQGFDYATMSTWSVGAREALHLVVPSLWYQPELALAVDPAIGHQGVPYLLSLYLGTALCFALAALRLPGHRRVVGLLLAAAGVGVLVSLGPATPLHPLLHFVPVLRSGRYPVKYLVLTVAAVAALCPFGLRAIAASRYALVVTAGAQTLGLAALLALVSSGGFVLSIAERYRPLPEARFVNVAPSSYPRIIQGAMTARVQHALGFSALLCLAAVVASREGRVRRVTLALLPALPLLDLALAAQFSIVGAPVVPRRCPPELRARVVGVGERVATLTPRGQEPAVLHREGATYFEDRTLSMRRRGVYWPGVRYLHDPDADGQSNAAHVFISQVLLRGAPPARARRLLARLGATWIASPTQEGVRGALSFAIPGEQPHFLLRLDDARPYVRAYNRWRAASIGDDQLALLHALTDTNTLETAVVFEREVAPSSDGPCAPTRAMVAQASTPTRIEAAVEGDCPSVVVALEVLTRGWVVTVDGAARPLLSAEGGLLGVFVPAGRHRVVFAFVSRQKWWGRWSLGAGIAVAAMFAAAAARRFRAAR